MDAIAELKALSVEIERGYEQQAEIHRGKLAELRQRIEGLEFQLATNQEVGDGPAPAEG
jgi:hypothetical protein